LHQANGADDPELRSLEGELLANEGRWDEAIGKFEEAFKTTPEDKRWLIQYRLPQSYLDAGKWADYYAAREEPREAFETLGDRFIENEDWKALAELVALHRTHAADDPRITKYEAELAWERQEYEEYVRRAAELLACTDENVVASYERPAIEHRRIRALLRSGRRNEAEELAREKQRKENDAALLAIVMAAAGDLVGAERLAREASESDESASSFYTDDEVGHLFLGPQFADLQEEFPVQLPYRASTTFAVFVSAEDWPLESAEVERAGRELGFAPLFPAAPVSAIGPNVERAFALRCDGGSVWVAVGKGKFDASWLADADQGAIAAGVNNSDAWLAVGAAAWTDAGREKIDPLARRLAVRLAAGRNAIVCAAAKNYWESFRAYEPSPELLEAWQSTGNLRPFRYDAVSLAADVEENNVAADRKFSRSLHEAVRAFEADPNRRFEVWANVSRRPALDPLRLRVRAVRRKYGSLEFDGTLESQSSLISELKPGLSMRLQEFELGAWRLDAADPVYRQP
ncbi:MAG: tetratricopeptide repeat protein, partial [Pirellulales bacterium]